jgi:two-component system, OmpR family, response regulator
LAPGDTEVEHEMRILMVEDDHILGGLICDALRLSNHEVRRVPTSESGVGAVLESRYDVLLLDLDLGMTRGEAMIQRVRNLGERLPPIIIWSGQPMNVLTDAAKVTGAAAVLRKPCTVDELLAAIDEASRSVSDRGAS